MVSILLRAGRREPSGKARCVALSGLGMFVYKELTNHSFHPKIVEAVNVLLLALKVLNKPYLIFFLMFFFCSLTIK